MQEKHLRACHDLIATELDVDYSFPICLFPFPIQRAVGINSQGRLYSFNAQQMMMRSQDLTDAYHDVGQFYWGRPDAFIEQRPVFSSKTKPMLIHRRFVVDIDTIEDWELAEIHAESIESIRDNG